MFANNGKGIYFPVQQTSVGQERVTNPKELLRGRLYPARSSWYSLLRGRSCDEERGGGRLASWRNQSTAITGTASLAGFVAKTCFYSFLKFFLENWLPQIPRD